MTTFIPSATQDIARTLFDSYDSFKAAEITSCRFTQAELLKWLRPFRRAKPVYRKFIREIRRRQNNLSLFIRKWVDKRTALVADAWR